MSDRDLGQEGELEFILEASLAGAALLPLLEAEEKKKGEKKEFEDAIVEAGAHLAELVANGKPPTARTEEEKSTFSVRASSDSRLPTRRRPANYHASVSFNLRTENEKAKMAFENVRGLFAKAKRVPEPRGAPPGAQHWAFRQGNARVEFHYVPGKPKGTYGCSVNVRAQTGQKAKSYMAALVNKLPAWAKQHYLQGLRARRESAEGLEQYELV
jgi:hypothetical protein